MGRSWKQMKSLRFKDKGEESVICFAFCFVSFITRVLQNIDHGTAGQLKKKTNLEICVTLFRIH